MTFILAGNYQQYETFCHRNMVPRNEVHYLNRAEQLRGLRGAHIICIGTFYKTKLWKSDMMMLVKNRPEMATLHYTN